MEAQKIKIELELTPEIAFLISVYLHSTAYGDFALQKMLSETGIKHIHEVAQIIMNQVSGKTDFDHMRVLSALNRLTHLDNADFQNMLRDLLN